MGNGIDSDAIQEIERLVNAARSIKLIEPNSEPDGVYYLQAADGSHQRVEAARKPYRTLLDTPDAFVAFVKGNGAEIADGDGVIFYTFAGIVFQMEDDYKGDVATCPLTVSPQFDWLQTESRKSLNQEAFVRLLRITFDGCLLGGNLLGIVRQIKWSNGDDGAAAIQHGKSSMSRAVVAQVMGVDAIPEEITLSVPVWANWHFLANVRCAIEIDTMNRTFNLTPFPLSLQRAKDAALAELAALLTAEGMPPAYLGRP